MIPIRFIKGGQGLVAEVTSQKSLWGTGPTKYEALGDLIMHHQEHFGINVEICNGDS